MKRAEITGPRSVRFDFAGGADRELPLILGLMPVLPKHAIDPEHFEETTFAPPVGSGPYIVKHVDAGRSATLRAQSGLLGREACRSIAASGISTRSGSTSIATTIPISRPSRRASTTCARKPIRRAGRPATTLRPSAPGAIVKDVFPTGLPKGMNALVFNTRRPVFADIRVREAIAMLFDFEWINKNFFFGLQRRTGSYFEGSESVRARPSGRCARTRHRSKDFPGAVREDVLEGRYRPSASDGSGRDRDVLKKALALFAAGRLRTRRHRAAQARHRRAA